jgi:hypothetical protein
VNPTVPVLAGLLAFAVALQPIAYDDAEGIFRKVGSWRIQTRDCWADRDWAGANPANATIGPNIESGQPPREFSLLFSSPGLRGRVGDGQLAIDIGFGGASPELLGVPAVGTERDTFALLSMDIDARLRARLESGGTIQVYRGGRRLLDLGFDGTGPAFEALEACVATWRYDDTGANATMAAELDDAAGNVMEPIDAPDNSTQPER